MIQLAQMKRLDMCFEDLDSIREAILALDLDRAIQEVTDLLTELVSINSGVDRGEPLESATTIRKVPSLLRGLGWAEDVDGR